MGTKEVRLLIINEHSEYVTFVSEQAEVYLHGYEVVCRSVTTGKEAISLLASWLPTLILLDAHLHDMNSVSLLKTLQGEQLPVIVTSENYSAEIEKSVKENGASAYMLASETQTDLENLFHKILELSADPRWTH